jgi:hypothetical protein
MEKRCKGNKCSKILEESCVSLCPRCTDKFLKKNKPISTSQPNAEPKAIEDVVAGLIGKHIMVPALRKK